MLDIKNVGEQNQVFYINQEQTIGSIAARNLVLGFKGATPASGAQLYSVLKTGTDNEKFNIIPYPKSSGN